MELTLFFLFRDKDTAIQSDAIQISKWWEIVQSSTISSNHVDLCFIHAEANRSSKGNSDFKYNHLMNMRGQW